MRRRAKEVRRMKKGVQVEKGGASGAERPSSNPTLSFSGESSVRFVFVFVSVSLLFLPPSSPRNDAQQREGENKITPLVQGEKGKEAEKKTDPDVSQSPSSSCAPAPAPAPAQGTALGRV